MTGERDIPVVRLSVPSDGDVFPIGLSMDDDSWRAEIDVQVGDEWVGLGKALADMEDRLLAAIAYAGRVPEVHPDRPVPPRFGPSY